MIIYRLMRAFLLLSVFMLISSSSVYANAGGEIAAETNSAISVIIDENLEKPFNIHWYRILLDNEILVESETGEYVKYESISKRVDAGKHILVAEGFYSGTGYGLFSYHSDIDLLFSPTLVHPQRLLSNSQTIEKKEWNTNPPTLFF